MKTHRKVSRASAATSPPPAAARMPWPAPGTVVPNATLRPKAQVEFQVAFMLRAKSRARETETGHAVPATSIRPALAALARAS